MDAQDIVKYLNWKFDMNWSVTYTPWGERIICRLTINGTARSAVGDNENTVFIAAFRLFDLN